MKQLLYKIPFLLAINTMLFMNTLIIIFHFLVLAQIIPFNIVWGGKFEDFSQVKSFEIGSIVIILLLSLFISLKAKYLNLSISLKIINAIIWLFALLFSLNTIGNLLTKTTTETVIFTPITFIFAIFCIRIVLEQKEK